MKSELLNRTVVNKFPFSFFILVFALSIPFWIVGGLTGLELLPGLPMSALSAFCPAAAACILVYKENHSEGVSRLLKRSFDYRRIRAKLWYLPILLLMPTATLVTYCLMHVMGLPLPVPQITVFAPLVLFVAFFIAALGEELGWSGHAIDLIQDRFSALQASVLLGLIWAAWHLVPLMQANRSPEWIAWWCLGTVATRVLMVWLYNNSGKSVFATALYHAIENLCWQLFPAYYDPQITSLVVAFAVGVVIVIWGPKTLAQYRYGQLKREAESSIAN